MMLEELVQKLATHPDVVRVAVSDREGLLIASANGPATAGTPTDGEIGDDLWNAYIAQFASNAEMHLKKLTLSQPREMVMCGTADSMLIVWVHVGWLIVRARPTADWATLRTLVSEAVRELAALVGESVPSESEA